jgi:hypothetical protein
MIVTHISMSIPSRRHREASWACSRPNASTCLVVGRPMVRRRREETTPLYRLATQRLDGCCSQIVRTAMTIGAPMKAPAIPQRKVQKKTARGNRNGGAEKDAARNPRFR